MATAARGAAAQKASGAYSGFRAAAERGRQAAWQAGSTTAPASSGGGEGGAGADGMPAWARQLHATQNARHRRQMAIHALQAGDRGGASATPDIKEKE